MSSSLSSAARLLRKPGRLRSSTKHRRTPAVLQVLEAPLRGSDSFWVVPACTTPRGQRPPPELAIAILMGVISSFVEMNKSAAATFPASVYDPPAVPANNLPALNINLGGVNVSLGGNTTGVYRTSGDMGVGVQADGIRDGMKTLFGKVKQGVDQIRNS